MDTPNDEPVALLDLSDTEISDLYEILSSWHQELLEEFRQLAYANGPIRFKKVSGEVFEIPPEHQQGFQMGMLYALRYLRELPVQPVTSNNQALH